MRAATALSLEGGISFQAVGHDIRSCDALCDQLAKPCHHAGRFTVAKAIRDRGSLDKGRGRRIGVDNGSHTTSLSDNRNKLP
jgi:hypothetical protein